MSENRRSQGVHVSLFEKIGCTGRADGRTDRVQHLMQPPWSHSKPCLYDKLHLLIQLFFRSNSRWIHVADKQNRSLSIAESMCQPCQGDMERDGCGSWTRIRQRELTGQQTQNFVDADSVVAKIISVSTQTKRCFCHRKLQSLGKPSGSDVLIVEPNWKKWWLNSVNADSF